MTELLDRAFQLKILKTLAARYPALTQLDGAREIGDKVTVNAWYLHQHGLIDAQLYEAIGAPPCVGAARITAKGMDFLADDGGLSAILGVVTIKLHDDTLRQLVAQKIEQSNLQPADKSLWLDALRATPAETMKHLAVKLMDLGLAHAPDALQQVGKLLGRLA